MIAVIRRFPGKNTPSPASGRGAWGEGGKTGSENLIFYPLTLALSHEGRGQMGGFIIGNRLSNKYLCCLIMLNHR
jgi:hypothetical protein